MNALPEAICELFARHFIADHQERGKEILSQIHHDNVGGGSR